MKKSYFFVFFSFLSFMAGAQTVTVISPTGDGGFETGTTFPSNGWTVVNPATLANQWVVGTAAGVYAGSRLAYVSNTGAAYAYTMTTIATCHFYRDITIPAGANAITLSFYYKGNGEIGQDRMFVSTAPTATTPVAGVPASPSTAITGATTIWAQASLIGVYTLQTVTLPSSLAGTTFRLIFTWQNNGSAGTAGPGAIDNISLTYCPQPASITGSLAVCVGSTTTLSSTTSGGIWSISPASVATISAGGVVTPVGAAGGTATVSYTNSCGNANTAIVTVNPLPAAITGPSTICGASSITLADATAGGSWNGGTQASASTLTPTTGLITGTGGGPTIVSYTLPTGCRVTKVVTVNALTPITGSLRQCAGATSILSHTITGGTWTSSNTTIATIDTFSGSLSALTGGMVTITYTTPCGIVTAVDTVVELTTPIVGRDTVCVGGTTALAHIVLGGVWTSQYTSVASVLTGSGLVTGVNPGTTTITYTVPPGCYTTRVVTVVAAPPAITGAFKTCVGTTTLLSDAAGGGKWSSGSSAIATVGSTTGIVTGVSANTVMITYTAAYGCIATQAVTVNPVPLPITGDVNKCPANADTLFDPSPGGTWSSLQPGIATVGATSGIITTVSGGSAVIRYTFPVSGCFVSKTIKVYPAPTPVISYDAYNATFYTSTDYVTYQWYDSLQGLIPGATTYKTAAKYMGDYYVVVTDSNGCPAPSNKLKNTKWLGFNEAEDAQLSIYPNPSRGIVYIETNKKVRVVISGIEGRSILEKPDAKEIDISNLANGIYLITVYDENGRKLAVQKLIKQE